MKFYTRYAVATEFIEEHNLSYNVQSITEKIETYINNCMDALGASLSELLEVKKMNSLGRKKVNQLQISEPLKEHLINVLSDGIHEVKDKYGNTRDKVTIINKTALADCMGIGAFGDEMPTEDAVFVTKQVVLYNFDDKIYEEQKERFRHNIKQLEEKRKDVLKRLENAGDLTNGLFLTTFNQNIFNSAEMEKYFQTVFYYFKEVPPTDEPSLDVRDMVLISFLGLTQQLKAIDKYLVREDFKYAILKNNNF